MACQDHGPPVKQVTVKGRAQADWIQLPPLHISLSHPVCIMPGVNALSLNRSFSIHYFLSATFKAPHAPFFMFLYLFGTDAQIQIPQRASLAHCDWAQCLLIVINGTFEQQIGWMFSVPVYHSDSTNHHQYSDSMESLFSCVMLHRRH